MSVDTRFTSCPDSESLKAFAQGELSERSMEQLANHLGTCANCDSQVRQAIAGDEVLRDLFRRKEYLDTSPSDPQFRELVLFARNLRGRSFEPRDDRDVQTDHEPTQFLSTRSLDSDRLPELQETPNLELPTAFGRYQVTGQLGSGGFGVVYKGWDVELQRSVAIKVAKRRRVENAKDAEAYLEEARYLASLDHPGIVPVFDVGSTVEGFFYLVSKLIDGTDLSKSIRASRLDYRASAKIVSEVATALDYAHRHGFVHRDVKPALGHWCDAYITIYGTWCEPLTTEVFSRMNKRLAEVHREVRRNQEIES